MWPRLIGFAAALALWGCANLNSIHHSFRPDSRGSLMVDAKQRAIKTVTNELDDGRPSKAVCAEPSPDALSALNASAAVDAPPSNLLNLVVSRILTASRRQTGLDVQVVDLAKETLRVWHLLT